MATGTAGDVGRRLHTNTLMLMSRAVAYNTAGIGVANVGVLLGTLPAGAVIFSVSVVIGTAFNAATTNVLTVGLAGDTGLDNIIATATVDESVANTGTHNGILGPGLGAQAAAVQVRISYTQTGTAATAGTAIVAVSFYIPETFY